AVLGAIAIRVDIQVATHSTGQVIAVIARTRVGTRYGSYGGWIGALSLGIPCRIVAVTLVHIDTRRARRHGGGVVATGVTGYGLGHARAVCNDDIDVV